MKAFHKNILERLDRIINDTGKHIHDFIDNPSAFTRKRALSAATVIKTTINMQGEDLTSELFKAFGQEAIKIYLIFNYLIKNIVCLRLMALILIKFGILSQKIL